MTVAGGAIQARLSEGLSGRYTVRKEVGQGGMATVYEALDHKHDRRVAMKVLRPEVAAALGRERFMSEIRIAANLSHPHILPVHESGEVDGLLFYVMPFVEGESLRDRLAREGKLSVEDALRITRDVGLALTYAHEQGVIHRDLKPENIMLSGGIAVVTDFGIARAISAAGHDRLTATGLVPGTPAYMSPEQATGESNLDARSDIYSIACVVYEMLAGSPPFTGMSLMRMIAQHAVAPVPQLRDTRPDVPLPVVRSIEVALAKEPKDRFATVSDFVASLEGRRATPLPVRAGRRLTSKATWIAAAVALAAVIGVAIWQVAGRAPSQAVASVPIVAVLPFEHIGAPEEKPFTDGFTDELSSRIGEIGGISVISRTSAMQFSAQRLRDVAEQLEANYAVAGSVKSEHTPNGGTSVRITSRLLRVPDGQEIWSEAYTAALNPGEMLKLQQNIAVSVANNLSVALRPDTRAPLEQGLTANLEAYKAYLQGNLSAAQFLVRQEQAKALEAYDRAVVLDPQFALAWARAAQTNATYYSLFDRSAERLRRLNEAVARASALAPNDPETQIARGYAAIFAWRNLDSATKELERAYTRQPNNARLLWALGFAQRQKGDLDAAYTSFTAASARDPRSPMYVFESITIPLFKHDYATAAQLSNRVRQLAPEFLPGMISMLQVQFYSGNLQAARDSLQLYAMTKGRELTLHMIGEPLLRPLWEMVVPDTLERILQRLTLAAAPVDSVNFYYTKGRSSVRNRRGDARDYFTAMRRVALGRRPLRPAGVVEYVDLAAVSLELADSGAARAYADSAWQFDPIKREALRGPSYALEIGRLYARLGDAERALTVLQRCLTSPGLATPWLLRTDPAFARLRTNPQFQQLAQMAS